jgi:cardiolipin synthase
MTPYFLPDERIVTALALAAIRGVHVDLILPERSNHRALDWAARAHIAPLVAAGCKVWTHPPPFDHSKLMTVDGTWCLIGSANWDARSLRLNFELDLEVYDPELARSIDALLVRRQRDPISAQMLDARPLPAMLRDSVSRLFLPYI